MFLLFGIFVVMISVVLILVLTTSVLVPILVAIPRVWWNRRKFFELLKEELYDWKEGLDVEKSFLFAVTFIIPFEKLSPKGNSELAGTFFLSIDCLDSTQYDQAYFAHGQYSLDWVVLVNLCNHEPLCLNFYLGW